MSIRQSILSIAFLCVSSFASNQLIFSKDTIHIPEYKKSDSLRITNSVDSAISIDSICFTWKIDNVTQDGRLGMNIFEPYNIYSSPSPYVGYELAKVKEGSDTSFYFTEDNITGRHIVVEPKRTLDLIRFEFGKSLYCSGMPVEQSKSGVFTINAVFVNNRKGRDTVYFTGPTYALLSSGTIAPRAGNTTASGKSFTGNLFFSASGRKCAVSGENACQKLKTVNLYFSKSGKKLVDLR
jgi:hypothetical protein